MQRTQRDLAPPFETNNPAADNRQQFAAQGMRTGYIDLMITGDITIGTADATAIRNSGSLLALINYITVKEQGDQPVMIDPFLLKALTEAQAARSLPARRLGVLAQGTYSLSEIVRIPFAWNLGMNAWRTAFVERTPASPTYVTYNPNFDTSRIAVAGVGGTVTLSNFQIRTIQTYDDAVSEYRPYFRPRITQTKWTITGANPEFRCLLNPNAAVRQMVFGQDNGVSMVSDIINGLRVRTDSRLFLGQAMMPYDFLTQLQANEFGGDIYGLCGGLGPQGPTVNSGVYVYNFQSGGLMSCWFVPELQGQNFRAEINCQPSVTSGVTTSTITIATVEMLKITGLTLPNQPFNLYGADI